MSIIIVEEIAFVGFAAPGRAAMRILVEDYGTVVAQVDKASLYVRDAGSTPFLHVTEQDAAAVAMLRLRAASSADLKRLATAKGVAVRDLDAPGGHRCRPLRSRWRACSTILMPGAGSVPRGGRSMASRTRRCRRPGAAEPLRVWDRQFSDAGRRVGQRPRGITGAAECSMMDAPAARAGANDAT